MKRRDFLKSAAAISSLPVLGQIYSGETVQEEPTISLNYDRVTCSSRCGLQNKQWPGPERCPDGCLVGIEEITKAVDTWSSANPWRR